MADLIKRLNLKGNVKSILKALVKDQLKKVFMGKEKKIINILTVFFIFHKSNIKTFLKWIFN